MTTTREIIEAVAEYRGIPANDLRSTKRKRPVAHARQEAFFIAKKATGLSLRQIGRHIGNRDHTTVLHGLAAVKCRMTDADYAKEVHDMICMAAPERKPVFKSTRAK
ncbi:hypothetical protein OU789_10905 [Halocynthiibacter sp. C4]|uniref:helix-turn-helix domain-containing protein n=1 Tax=Halocynthiibacter sp. C4 TaxID=2992758 RepID=UPI00237B8B94|nr:helix-turn-helix domain-containing protein [Halocynthiibacter sp. C4]MDE0590436.1 hypothetical protein [Halocynthiibacter sp. C4]